MTSVLSDLAQSARRLLGSPGFTLATVASIGIGVGLNATVFSAANTLLLKPLSVPSSGELVRIYTRRHSPLTGRHVLRLQQSRAFEYVFGETLLGAAMSTPGAEPERVRVSLASDNLFRGLRVVPAAGRLFLDDESPAAGPQVVLSYEFWQRRFGGDRAALGSAIQLNDQSFTVIGVAPQGVSSAQAGWWSDLVVPARNARVLTGQPIDSMAGSLYTTGRLRPGVSLEQANTELQVVAAEFLRADSSDRDLSFRATPARGITEEVRQPAAVASAFLMVIALLVLVIAATNVGNLMLARNATRQRELGVRMALGASRSRLIRLLLAEATLVALVAGAVAWLIAQWTTAFLPNLVPADAEVRFTLAPDWRVLLFTFGVCCIAVLLFGLIPARVALRQSVSEDLKEGAAIGQGLHGTRVRRRFLLVQVALCAVLLSTGSLFLRSLSRASSIQLGFSPERIVVAPLDLTGRATTDEQAALFFDRVLREAETLPGVESATYERIVSLTGSSSETTYFTDLSTDSTGRGVYFNTVGPNYHRTLGVALMSGRDFSPSDGPAAPLVAIVNETFAAREWPGQDPLGRRLSVSGPRGPWHTVVGVSRTVKYHTLGEDPKAFVTLPSSQVPRRDQSLEVRVAATANEREVMAALGRLVRELDPQLPPPAMRRLTDLQSVVLLPARAAAAALGGIGAIAFLLAAVGVGGVAAYAVAQRRREIGVRVALGAPPATMLRAVLGETWRTVAIGSVAGLVLAGAVSRVLHSQLFGVSTLDPVTFATVPALLVALGVGAAWVPARRALAVSAIEALRSE